MFWYTVEGKGYSLRDLRSIQDWYVRYQLNSVPGVAEVASVGGVVRQYQIDVDPKRLACVPGPDLRGGGRRHAKQPQCRGQRGRGERDLVGHPRPRAHRERAGPRAGGDRRRRRRADLCPPGRRREGRRRLPGGRARQGRRGGGGWRRGRALRREHRRGHRASQREDRRAPGRAAAGRSDRAVLRPVEPDRARRRHAQALPDRGGGRRHRS